MAKLNESSNNLRRFRISSVAIRDLKEIADYGKRFFAKDTQKKFQQGLKKVFEMLRDRRFEIGVQRDEIKQGLLMFPYRRYNLYFYRTEDEIILLRVLRSEIDTLEPSFGDL